STAGWARAGTAPAGPGRRCPPAGVRHSIVLYRWGKFSRLPRHSSGYFHEIRFRPAVPVRGLRQLLAFHIAVTEPCPGSREQRIKHHHRLYGVIFVFVLTMGALLARLLDLQRSLSRSEGYLGLRLQTMAVGALAGLMFSSH